MFCRSLLVFTVFLSQFSWAELTIEIDDFVKEATKIAVVP